VFGQVGTHGRAQGAAVDGDQDPGEGEGESEVRGGTVASGQVAALPHPCRQADAGASAPLGDLLDGPRAGDHRARADQQNADQGIPTAAARARVRDALEKGAETPDAALVERTQFGQDGKDGRR